MQEKDQENGSTQEEISSSQSTVESVDVQRGVGGAGVTPVQEVALRRLFAGSSIQQAARAAKVDRRTLSRWLHDDHHFATAYNAWRQEMIASGRARVLAMNDLALDTVQNAMLQGNVRVAVQVAKANGALDAPKPGTTDPAWFRLRHKRREEARQDELASAEYQEDLKRQRDPARRVAYCEDIIDAYVKHLHDALRAEPPEARTARLADEHKRHRDYHPTTLRLLTTLEIDDPIPPTTSDAQSTPDARDADSAAPPPVPAADAPPEAEATDRATEANETETPAPVAVPTDGPPDTSSRVPPAAPIAYPEIPSAQRTAFPGARPAQADSPEPEPASSRHGAGPIHVVPYDGSDDDEPGWTRLA